MARLLPLLLLLASAAPAAAQRAPDMTWQSHWASVSAAQYVYMTALVGVEGYLEFGPVRSKGEPRVKGPWPGDEVARALLRVDDEQTVRFVDTLTDVLWWPALAFPLYADALGAALIGHGEAGTAWQLTAISIQGLLTTTLVTRLLHVTVRRQRPVYTQAEEDGVELHTNLAETLSFPGGHAATSFAGAGLACSFHRNLPLFGGGWAEDAVCPLVLGVAGTTAFLRIVIDRHYFTDTLAGASIGFAVGYFLPQLLHFHDSGDASQTWLLPWADERGAGLSLRVVM